MEFISDADDVCDGKSEEVCNTQYSCETGEDGIEVDITLDTLPPELLIRICDFLDARTIHVLQQVCKTFEQLFTGDTYFRTRITRRWPKKYPPVQYDSIDWQEACYEREGAYLVWTNQKTHLEYFTYTDCLFAPIDAVHLMKEGQLLAAGSRDRYLTILDLSKYDPLKESSMTDMKVYSDSKAHQGWIWSLDSLDNILATGSWDTYIKLWDLEAGVVQTSKFKCKSAILDLHMENNLIIAGGYDRKVHMVDIRGCEVSVRRSHKQAVLCLAVDDKYIITGSEDKTICVFDRIADKVFKTITLETYPLDMSYGNNQLWFGDKKGQLHLVDTSDGAFDVVESYDIGHQGQLTGVIHTLGALYTCSTDHSIKVLEPSRKPGVIANLDGHKDGVAGISYQNGVLASAGCDIAVGIWRPKQQPEDCVA